MKKSALEEIQDKTDEILKSVNDIDEALKDQSKALDQLLTILAVRK